MCPKSSASALERIAWVIPAVQAVHRLRATNVAFNQFRGKRQNAATRKQQKNKSSAVTTVTTA